MRTLYYTLDANGEPVPEPDVLAWARWYEATDRQVALTELDGVGVSTVFLGVDHDFTGSGLPVLWETAVKIEGQNIDVVQRHTSRLAALAAHDQIVASAREHLVTS